MPDRVRDFRLASGWLLALGWMLYLLSFVVPEELSRPKGNAGLGLAYFFLTPFVAASLLRDLKFWNAFWLGAGWLANFSILPWYRPHKLVRGLAIATPWLMKVFAAGLDDGLIKVFSSLPFYFWAIGISWIQIMNLLNVGIGRVDGPATNRL